jgi:hypothetical protein
MYSAVEPSIVQPNTYCPLCGHIYNPLLDVQPVVYEQVVYADPLAVVLVEEIIIAEEEYGY